MHRIEKIAYQGDRQHFRTLLDPATLHLIVLVENSKIIRRNDYNNQRASRFSALSWEARSRVAANLAVPPHYCQHFGA